MKLIRKVMAIAAAFCIAAAASPSAFADNEVDARFEGKTWEQVVDQYIADHDINIYKTTLGYCNLVTGEEHYYNPDQYMIAASLYKVPLNMYFNDRVFNGEIGWDTIIGYETTYEYLMRESIVFSNNELAGVLMSNMGGYQAMRRLICPYMGEDETTVAPEFLTNDYFSAREMIHCLKLLYDNPDRYARIVDCMKEAEPTNYFKFDAQKYDVAHKYGFLLTDFSEVLNDCAIVYTDEPIAIVMLADTLTGGYNTMSEFCTLMADYAQYTTTQRLASEAAEEEKAAAEAAARAAAAAAAVTPEPIAVEESAKSTVNLGGLIAAALCLVAAVAALVFIIKAGAARRLKTAWGILAVLLTLAALLLCVVGSAAGTLVAKPDGDPRQTVSEFFNAIQTGNYETAYGCLKNTSSLGLENAPSTDTGRLVYDALRRSYGYTLIGECAVDKMKAYQQLDFNYLDLTSFESDVQSEVPAVLEAIVQSRSHDEVYDANDKYLPSVTDEAYTLALTKVLANARSYYTTVRLTLELEYSGGKWLIVAAPDILKALIGGVAY